MRKHENSISTLVLAVYKTPVSDLSRYFTLSLNRTSRNYIGFDSLITISKLAFTEHQCNHASRDSKSFFFVR